MTLFLAFYTASAVVHVASATAMTIQMAEASANGMDASHDCQGCEADVNAMEDGQLCDMVCAAPLAATASVSSGLILTAPLSHERPLSKISANSRTGPPEPFPPRTLI